MLPSRVLILVRDWSSSPSPSSPPTVLASVAPSAPRLRVVLNRYKCSVGAHDGSTRALRFQARRRPRTTHVSQSRLHSSIAQQKARVRRAATIANRWLVGGSARWERMQQRACTCVPARRHAASRAPRSNLAADDRSRLAPGRTNFERIRTTIGRFRLRFLTRGSDSNAATRKTRQDAVGPRRFPSVDVGATKAVEQEDVIALGRLGSHRALQVRDTIVIARWAKKVRPCPTCRQGAANGSAPF